MPFLYQGHARTTFGLAESHVFGWRVWIGVLNRSLKIWFLESEYHVQVDSKPRPPRCNHVSPMILYSSNRYQCVQFLFCFSQPNAAGRRVRQLIKGEWRTNESHSVQEGQNLRVRGFKGGYTVQVKHNGNVIKTEHFTLGGNGVDLTISLSGSGT